MILNNKSHFLLLLTIVFFSHFAIAIGQPSGNLTSEEQTLHKKSDTPPPTPTIHRVLIYRDSKCKGCDEVHEELKKHNIESHDIDLAWNRKQRLILERKAGKSDVSYVFIGNKYIGNHNDLMTIIKHGRLFRVLQDE
jgi:glutaredoxin